MVYKFSLIVVYMAKRCHRLGISIVITAISIASSAPVYAHDWNYFNSTDEIDGTKSQTAILESDNKAHFDFPYNGGSVLEMAVAIKGTQQWLTFHIVRGQFHCMIDDGCTLRYKMQSGDAVIALGSLTVYPHPNGRADLVINAGEPGRAFVESVRRSMTVKVELPFFNEGRRTFTFKPESDGPKF